MVDTGMGGYVQQPVVVSEELLSGDESKSTECPNSPSGSENEYSAESPATLDWCTMPTCGDSMNSTDNQFGEFSFHSWTLQDQENTADNDYTWTGENTNSLFEGLPWENDADQPELFEPSHWP